MRKLKILVLCGGVSSERNISVLSGNQVANSLNSKKYIISKVVIEKNGTWKAQGGNAKHTKARRNFNPIDIIKKIKPDVVFIILHGKGGEDGKVQALCEMLSIPYTGSGVMASASAMNKIISHRLIEGLVASPKYTFISSIDYRKNKKSIVKTIKKEIGFPCIVKPNESGSSIGMSIAKTSGALYRSITGALKEDKMILVQKYIKGREFTCGVLGNSSTNDNLVALPVVEIIPKSEFFNHKAKYSGSTAEVCPAEINNTLEKQIKHLATLVHKRIFADGLTRTDFIYSKGKLYFLEINTIPGATEESLAPKEAKAMGWTYGEFLDKQISLALKKHNINVAVK